MDRRNLRKKSEKNIFKLIFIYVLIQILTVSLFADNPGKITSEVVIKGFTADSYLYHAGARSGDIIIGFNGVEVSSLEHLENLRKNSTSKTIQVNVLRNQQKKTFRISAGNWGALLKELHPDHNILEDAVIIENIGKLDWENGKSNSFIACVEHLNSIIGIDLSYNDLIGLSGYGFRFHLYPGLCPSSPDATVGWNSGSYLLKNLGYDFDIYYLNKSGQNNFAAGDYLPEDKFHGQIIKSIDKGWPVIALNLIQAPEWGLITGYQNKGKDFFCRTYYDHTGGYEIADNLPGIIYVINNHQQRDIEYLYPEVFTIARELYNTPIYDRYFSGIKAIQEWMYFIAKDDLSAINKTLTGQELMNANWWMYFSLLESRKAATDFLNTNRNRFRNHEKEFHGIAAIYSDEIELLSANIDKISSPIRGDLYPDWTLENRLEQYSILKKLLALERKVNLILLSIQLD